LLDEHAYMIQKDWEDEFIPYWITYYTEDGDVIRGFDKKDLLDLQKQIHFSENDKDIKQRQMEELNKFLKNPVAFSHKKYYGLKWMFKKNNFTS